MNYRLQDNRDSLDATFQTFITLGMGFVRGFCFSEFYVVLTGLRTIIAAYPLTRDTRFKKARVARCDVKKVDRLRGCHRVSMGSSSRFTLSLMPTR